MTRIATSGTYSCATISISGFSDYDRDINNKFLKDGTAEPKKFPILKKDGDTIYSEMTPAQFYSKVLYPISQPLGCTKDYPFDNLMDVLEDMEMKGKMIFAILNEHQYFVADHYWPKALERRGFSLVDTTRNSIGTNCFLFIRNFNRIEGVEVTTLDREEVTKNVFKEDEDEEDFFEDGIEVFDFEDLDDY